MWTQLITVARESHICNSLEAHIAGRMFCFHCAQFGLGSLTVKVLWCLLVYLFMLLVVNLMHILLDWNVIRLGPLYPQIWHPWLCLTGHWPSGLQRAQNLPNVTSILLQFWPRGQELKMTPGVLKTLPCHSELQRGGMWQCSELRWALKTINFIIHSFWNSQGIQEFIPCAHQGTTCLRIMLPKMHNLIRNSCIYESIY